jgi:DNA polymerase-3 subunit beta
MINLDKDQLLINLKKLQSIVDKKSTDHIKIEGINNTIILTATDTVTTIQTVFKSKFDEDFGFTINAKKFFNIIKLLKLKTITIDLTNISECRLIAGMSHFTLPCLSVFEFPSFEEIESGLEFTIPSVNLHHYLDKTKHACLNSHSTMNFLNGIYFTSPLTTVATDFHRLAIVSHENDIGADFAVIIPRKTVLEIIKLTHTSKETKIIINSNKIQFTFDNTILTSKLIDGNFCSYKSLLEINFVYEMNIDCKEFINALELVTALSDENIKIIKLHLLNNKILFSLDESNKVKGGTAQCEIEVENRKNHDVTVFFNTTYLHDILNVCNGPRIIMKFVDAQTPFLIKDIGDKSITFILMPMESNENI